MHIAAIENWEAFMLPEVSKHLARWVKDPDAWLILVQRVVNGRATVLAGSSDPATLQAICIIVWPDPDDIFHPLPLVEHFHCDGGAKVRRRLVLAVVACIAENGYTAFTAVNTSGAPDTVWARAFADAGRPKGVATVFRFTPETGPHGQPKRLVRRKRDRAKAKLAADRVVRQPGHKHHQGHDARRATGSADPVRPGARVDVPGKRRPSRVHRPARRPHNGR